MDEKKIARAEHKYARISPRKVEIICNMIRGKDAKVAMALMENTPKAGCELMIKVLKSAMANAENNFEMDPEKLYVCQTFAGAGPILKRGMPRAQCTASTSAPATSSSPWLRETKGRRQNYGTESESPWPACRRY